MAFTPSRLDNGIRWTNGDAALPACLFEDLDFGCEVVLRVGGRTRYVDEGSVLRRVA